MRSPSAQKRPRPDPSAILRGHLSPPSSLHFLPSGLLASGDESGLLRLWHPTFEESVLSNRNRTTSPLLSIIQDPSRPQTLTIHNKNGTVHLLDLHRDDTAIDLTAWHADHPTALTTTAQKSRLFAESFCKALYLSPQLLAGPVQDGDAAGVFDVRVPGSASEVARFNSPRSLRERTMAESSSAVRDDSGMLMALTCVTDGRRIVAGYEDGSVCVWDVRVAGKGGKPVGQTMVGDESVTCLSASPGGNVCVAGGAFSGLVAVGDVEDEEIGVLRRGLGGGKGVADVVWGMGGRIVVSGGWDGRVRLWDGRRRREKLLRQVGSFRWHEGGVGCVAVGEGVVASGGKDRTIAVWRHVLE